MSLKIDDFLARLNRKGTLNPVSESTRKAYRNSLEQFGRFLNRRQPTQKLAQEWIQQLLNISNILEVKQCRLLLLPPSTLFHS